LSTLVKKVSTGEPPTERATAHPLKKAITPTSSAVVAP
jgi:hypothetical protein